MKDLTIRRSLRGAIYTRVSTERGLEQDFNSLDAQREACEAYIKSQAHTGDWFGIVTTTAASPAGRWRGQRSRSCSSRRVPEFCLRPLLSALCRSVASPRSQILPRGGPASVVLQPLSRGVVPDLPRAA
jgi:hypothetical protein